RARPGSASRAALAEPPERQAQCHVVLGRTEIVERVVRAITEHQRRPSGEKAARPARQGVRFAGARLELDESRVALYGAVENRLPLERRIDLDRDMLGGSMLDVLDVIGLGMHRADANEKRQKLC